MSDDEMTFTPPMPEHIRSLPPYVPGRPPDSVAREFGIPESAIVKLASNENPRGMSPAAKRALAAFAGDIGRYPDPDSHDLKGALARMLDVEPNWLTIGSGSSEILEMAGRAFLAPGRSAVLSQYSFAVYRSAIRTSGATMVVTPAAGYGHDLAAMAAAVGPDVDLVFVGNPNNPTGTYVSQREFEGFLGAVAGRAVVVLDEAYLDYLAPEERFDSIALVKAHSNLIVARTFSKAYGLAGLRVGFAIAQPPLSDALNRVRPVFNVTVLGQLAARAALEDKEFLEESRRLNQEGMAFLEAFCRQRGLEYVPSKGNFVLIRVPDAAQTNRQLLQRGVIVRPVANYGLDEWLRVSVGLPEEIRRFAGALDEVLGAIPA